MARLTLYGSLARQGARKHGAAWFKEGLKEQVVCHPGPLRFGMLNLESQRVDLFPIELKHKILGEAMAVFLRGSIQVGCGAAIERC